jgi:hypothetical protein
VRLTPDHVLAGGSLPPGFPMPVIEGVPYWDGGLFDNTPIKPLPDLLTEDELEDLPIFIVNLFATHSDPPREVQERMLEISFESRFLLAHADADGSLTEFTRTIEEIMRDLPSDSNDGIRLSTDNAVEDLHLVTQAAHLAVFNDTSVTTLGRIELHRIRTVGSVRLIANVRSGHVEARDVDVVAADARGYGRRPAGYGVKVIPGAFMVWNQQPDRSVTVTAELKNISAGARGCSCERKRSVCGWRRE